ncbi:SubName: Full=Uncharacterized protein {ECO:0000313/EMBL:CCA76603.1} [Serendipita indica DSM 11827]|nr:SubName: Full=Uncharacterized protein {ECO:0000313/EMBL:CCA76603.1} [Serendipita indica DSM 11827]
MPETAAIEDTIPTETDGVDYLGRLPDELWRLIFLATLPPRRGLAGDPITFFNGLTTLDNQVLGQTQKQRANMRLICKALQSIALELLFTDVQLNIVSNSPVLFLKAVELGGSLSRHAGLFTRCLTFKLYKLGKVNAWKEARYYQPLREIFKLCPNVGTVEVEASLKSQSEFTLDWLPSINSLIWQGGYAHMGGISRILARNAQIEDLLVETGTSDTTLFRWPNESQPTIHLPHLKHLQLTGDGVSDIGSLSVPNVRWLNLEFVDMELKPRIVNFISANCLHLTFLQIQSRRKLGGSNNMDAVLDFIYLCPNLETVYLSDSWKGLYSPGNNRMTSSRNYEPHPSLHTGIFTTHGSYHATGTLHSWGFHRPQQRYPHFKRVILRLTCSLPHNSEVYQKIKAETLGLIGKFCTMYGTEIVLE